MKRILILLLCLCSLGLHKPVSGQEQEQPKKLGGIGDAFGFVVDAENNHYLEGAHVQLLLPPNIQAIKGSEANTSKEGFYRFKASLGTVSTSLATERIFDLSIASILFGGAQKTERHINVSQLNVRVTKDGYKPFVGPLLIYKADLEDNRVWLFPVKLAALNQPYLSYASNRNDLGKIESITLSTNTPDSGEEVTWHVSASQVPLLPGEKIYFACEILGTLSESQVQATQEADGLAFNGKITMKTTEIGVFSRDHKNLKAGVYRLVFKFTDPPKTVYDRHNSISWEVAPQAWHLVTWRFVAVGIEADKKAQADAELAKLNTLPAEKINTITPEIAATLRRVRALLPAPVPERPNPILTAVAEFKAGNYEKAWKTFQPYATYLPTYGPIFKAAAEVQKNPGDFKARAELRSLCRILDEDETGSTSTEEQGDKLSDVKKGVKLPAMPPPKKSEDKLFAAKVLLADGEEAQALNYLQELTAVPAFRTRAQMALAEQAYNKHDTNSAASLFETAFASNDADKAPGFYPRFHYGLMLLKQGQTDKAETMFARALAHGRNTTEDYSRPSSQVLAAGQSYTVYSAPMRSGIVGYAYPEASLVQLVLSNYDALANPDADWLSTAVLGRALAELGCLDQSQVLLSKIALQHPDEQFALASYAVALKISGDETRLRPVVDQLLKLNPRNPDVIALSSPQQNAPH